MPHDGESKTPPPHIARASVALGLLVILLLSTWNIGRLGLASLFTAYAAQSGQLSPANTAVSLSAGSPDAHYVRSAILEPTDLPGATSQYQSAALSRTY